MNWRQIFTVFRKELLETLRDRRALISVFLVPTVVIPALMLGSAFVSVKAVQRAQAEVPSVMLIGGADSPLVRAALAKNERLELVPFAADHERQITDKRLRAAVEVPDDFDAILQAGGTATVKIQNYEGEIKSGFAAAELASFFTTYGGRVLRERLVAQGLPESFIRPVMVKRENVAPPEKVGGATVGGVVPYLLILLCFTGAMYPALDLSAGEKERGTLETILCSPVGRTELVLGKFLLILSASLATVVCSLGSLGLTAWLGRMLLASQKIMPAGTESGLMTVSLPGVLGVCLLVLPLAVLFSAVLFAVALCAKTYKEAQSYVSPLIFIVILPAVGAMLPGVELTTKLALVPLLNVSLVSKEMVAGNFPIGMIALIFASTCVYAAAALYWAVRMFNRESVLFRT